MKKKDKLTLKQKRFADEYIISGNATQSAIKAGYSKKTAGVIAVENLEKPNIKAYIGERLKELDDKAIAKQEEVLQYLTAVMRGQSKSAVVVIEGLGEGLSEARLINKTPDEKDRIKAAELLGKRYGAFTEKVDISGDMSLSIEVDYGTEDTNTKQ
ncbi:MAG: terminase small subunit [[Eubacterium] sulci]|nr:terminase small subunit [[Eubacterium] sulci]DAS51413.1 MAG TPA: Terminase small subunit [Caudoviricetes sp.]